MKRNQLKDIGNHLLAVANYIRHHSINLRIIGEQIERQGRAVSDLAEKLKPPALKRKGGRKRPKR